MVGRIFELILHSVLVITEPGLDEVLGCCYRHHHEGTDREGRVSSVSFLDKVKPGRRPEG